MGKSEGALGVLELSNRVNLISTKGANGNLPLPSAVSLFEKFGGAMRGKYEPPVSAEDSPFTTRVCLKAREAAHRET